MVERHVALEKALNQANQNDRPCAYIKGKDTTVIGQKKNLDNKGYKLHNNKPKGWFPRLNYLAKAGGCETTMAVGFYQYHDFYTDVYDYRLSAQQEDNFYDLCREVFIMGN